MALLDYFITFKNLNDEKRCQAVAALEFLRYQFEETSRGALDEFDEIWRNGKESNSPEINLGAVAYHFDPALAHHDQAIKYLANHISPETYQKFGDIWFGRDHWLAP